MAGHVDSKATRRQSVMKVALTILLVSIATAASPQQKPRENTAAADAEGKALLREVIRGLGGEAKVKSVRAVRALSSSRVASGGQEHTIESETIVVGGSRLWQKQTSPEGEMTLVVTPTQAFVTARVGSQPAATQSLDDSVQPGQIRREMARDPIFVSRHADDPEFTFRAGGTASVGGQNAKILDVRNPSARVRWFVDPQSGRILRATYKDFGRSEEGGEAVEEFSDWKQVDGLWFPFKEVDTGADGQVETLAIKQMQVDPAVDMAIFRRPGVPEAVSDAEGKALLGKAIEALGGEAKLNSARSLWVKGAWKDQLAQEPVPFETIVAPGGKLWFKASERREEIVMIAAYGDLLVKAGPYVHELPPDAKDGLLLRSGQDPDHEPVTVAQHALGAECVARAAGSSRIGEVEAKVLEVSYPGGEVRWHVDPKSGRILRGSWQIGGERGGRIQRDYSDWKPVNGVWFAFRQTLAAESGEEAGTAIYNEVEINPQIDPQIFEKPTYATVERAEMRALFQARAVHIVDRWGGLGLGHGSEYRLRSGNAGFQGEATFKAGQLSEVRQVSVPRQAAQEFLSQLSGSTLQEREYVPSITHTDDYPSLRIDVETADGTVVFSSESQGREHVPWAVTIKEKTYVIDSAVPAKALAVLAPYLQEDVMKKLMERARTQSR